MEILKEIQNGKKFGTAAKEILDKKRRENKNQAQKITKKCIQKY